MLTSCGWLHVVVSTTNSGSTTISWVAECHELGSSVIVVNEGSLWHWWLVTPCRRGGGATLHCGCRIFLTGSGEGVEIRSGWVSGTTLKKKKKINILNYIYTDSMLLLYNIYTEYNSND